MRCHDFTAGQHARQLDRRTTFTAQCFCFFAALSLLATSGCGYDNRAGAAADGAKNQLSAPKAAPLRLLNVSYDPTRELWASLNSAFIPIYERDTGIPLVISQSHAGSSNQARAIAEGLDADVATLAMWRDIELIRQNGLVKDGWEERLPHHSLPYYSTIVFVVRKGNPKNIHDWPDLVREGVEIITPNPRTGGNGKLSFLAAWGSVLVAGGSEADAQRFVTQLFQHVPVLDAGARAATITFARKQIGDVHLTWENEARLEVDEAAGELEIVYPKTSIRAEPPVVVVDANVDRKGTRAAAEAYLKFLYSDEAQEIIARHYYRPIDPSTFERFSNRFGKIELFEITKIVPSWEAAHEKFFAEGGIFDSVYGQ
jgi:sulfate transport system substrate-binding protein